MQITSMLERHRRQDVGAAATYPSVEAMEKNSSSACAFGSHIENRSKGSCASMYQRLEPASQRAPSACASEYSSGGTKRYVRSTMISDGQFGHCAAPGEFWTVGTSGGGIGLSGGEGATPEEFSGAGMGP